MVSILVDIGSMHNFVQSRLVNHLGLFVQSAHKFFVLIGNGNTLTCEGMCEGVAITIRDWSYLDTFYILPIQGSKIALRVQWLNKLRPITVDYSKLLMEFYVNSKLITVIRDTDYPEEISHHQLKRLW